MPRIVCLSDTHNCNEQIVVPDGDILIHAGDATFNGTVEEIERFNDWFAGLPHPHKVFIAGNHDWLFERDNNAARSLLDESITYLQDSAAEVAGLRFYGSPWQPHYFFWAFNLDRGAPLAAKWSMIPEDTEILVTHCPPHGIWDTVARSFGVEHGGCEDLRDRVRELQGKGSLKLHVFGHFHHGHGREQHDQIVFVNASTCDEAYLPTQAPLVGDI